MANTGTPSTSQIRRSFIRVSHTDNLPTTEGLRHSSTSANIGQEGNNSNTCGYSIDDTAQAFKALEEEQEKKRNAILDGHLDKLFRVDFPETIQRVSALRTVRVVSPRATTPLGEEAVIEEVGRLRQMKQIIEGTWRAGVTRWKGIGERPEFRGRTRRRRSRS